MAIQAAVFPQSRLSLGAPQCQSPSMAECGGAPRGGVSWSSCSSWQGIRMTVPSLSTGQRRRGGVPRAEQAEVVTSAPPAEPKLGKVIEVDKDTFWPIVKSAGDKVVVLDMYTQWCGPCKMMLPKIVDLSEKLDDVIFTKLDCNQHNKSLAKELGIRVVPTFKIFKNNVLAGEVTGARFNELVKAIDAAKTGESI